MYRSCHPLLIWLAVVKGRVPCDEAETIIQEAFVSFMTCGVRIDYPKAWLVGAVCNGARHYWRVRSRVERRESRDGNESPLVVETAHQLETQFLVQKVVRYLTAQQREVLHLHYAEGMTAAEIAQHLGTTSGYAEKLIHKSLKRAREVLELLHPVRCR